MSAKEKIACLQHNIEAHKAINDQQYKVLLKLYHLLESCGYTKKELNEYLMSNKLDSNWLLEPKQKFAIQEAQKTFKGL